MNARALGTLLGREWRASWSAGGGYALRAIYPLALLLASAAAWGVGGWSLELEAERYADYSRVLFIWTFRAQMVGVLFMGAIGFAKAVMREKERSTLEYLILSPLTGFEILLSKAVAELLGVAALLVAGLPLLFLMLPLGGMSLVEILSEHLLLLGVAAAAGGLFTALAAWANGFYGALLASWTAVLAFVGAPHVGPLLWPGGAGIWKALGWASPFALLHREAEGVWKGFGGPAIALAAGLGIMGFFCFAGGLVLAGRHARRRDRVGREGLWTRLRRRAERATRAKWLGRIFRPLLPARHSLVRRECSIERDFAFRAGWVLFVAVFAATAAMAWSATPRRFVGWHALVAAAAAAGAIALAVVRVSVSVADDKRRGGFETLLAANVEPEDIVRAKLAGGLVRAAYLAALPAAHAVAAALILAPSWETRALVLRGLVGLALGVLAAMVVTVAVSVGYPGRAAAASHALVAALPAGLGAGALAALGAPGLAVLGAVLLAALGGIYGWTVRSFRRRALAP